MFTCQKSEGVHSYLLTCCRGTCSFVGMLKGYMERKRLGTPASGLFCLPLDIFGVSWSLTHNI